MSCGAGAVFLQIVFPTVVISFICWWAVEASAAQWRRDNAKRIAYNRHMLDKLNRRETAEFMWGKS